MIAALLEDDAILNDARIAAEVITDEIIAADRHSRPRRKRRRDPWLASAVPPDRRRRRSLHRGEMRPGADGPGQSGVSWSPDLGQSRVRPPAQRYVARSRGIRLQLGGVVRCHWTRRIRKPGNGMPGVRGLHVQRRTERVGRSREMADAAWPCKWCYGAPGIGLARIAMTKLAGVPVS